MPSRHRQILAGLITAAIATSAAAQTPATPAEGSKAVLFAMGMMAYGECTKVGFKVNPNGWHALVEHGSPGLTVKDFTRGGRFEAEGRAAVDYVSKVFDGAGAQTWCGYMAAWAKVAHPRIWGDLISR